MPAHQIVIPSAPPKNRQEMNHEGGDVRSDLYDQDRGNEWKVGAWKGDVEVDEKCKDPGRPPNREK
jgi:hypothetical protein